MVTIERVQLSDAVLLTVFLSEIYAESEYLLYDMDEYKASIEKTTTLLKKVRVSDKSCLFIAKTAEKVVGFIYGDVQKFKKISHVMKINIALLKAYRSLGIGKALSQALIEHVKATSIKRMEITVIKENEISLNLCKKFGFEVEGVKINSIKVNNKFHDEYMLARLV